jgi:hypothetical protein
LVGSALGLFLGAIGYALGYFVAPNPYTALIIPITLYLDC